MTAVDGMDSEIINLTANFKSADAALKAWKEYNRPFGCVVYVEWPEYTGYGVVVRDDDCTRERIAVKLENGKVWWYPVEHSVIAEKPGRWPEWIKKLKGIKR